MADERLTVYFPHEAFKVLSSLRQRSRLGSGMDVLVAALDCYGELLEIERRGGSVEVRRDERSWAYSVDYRFSYPGFDEQKKADDEPAQEDAGSRNFIFPRSALEKFARIRKLSRYQTSADIIRAALASFDELVRVSAQRDKIYVIDCSDEKFQFSPFAPFDLSRLDFTGCGKAAAAAAVPNSNAASQHS